MAQNKSKIYIVDVTNRDGVQTSRLGLAKLEKTMINYYLNDMGIYQSEFGFPTTKHEINYLNANLDLAKKGVLSPIRLSGWMRAVSDDVSQAFKNCPQLKIVNLSISTSDQMIKGKFGDRLNRKDIIRMAVDAIKSAYSCGAEDVGINAEDATRTYLDYLVEFALASKEAGAKRFRYCDTLGYLDPQSAYENVKYLAKNLQMPIEVHYHNILGMAVANSVMSAKAAIEEGCDCLINTSVNGMGEEAGNADLVSVILALKKSKGFESKKYLDERVDLSKAYKIAKYASYAFGVPIPINQPGVGDNIFAHESGIHADGVLKDEKNYELFSPQELGRGHLEFIETGRKITTGEYSGIKGFKHTASKIDITFKDDNHAREILDLVRYANVLKQKPITDDELKFIYANPLEAKHLMRVDL